MKMGWTSVAAFLALLPLAVTDDGDSTSEVTQTKTLIAHGLVTSIAFVILFPLFAVGLHIITWSKTVPRIHAPLQLFTLCLALSGLGLGVYASLTTEEQTDSIHVTIGLVVVGGLLLVQPLVGLIQHLHFRRTSEKTWFAYIHRWFGRLMIIIGVINGGLGLMLAGDESATVPKAAIIVYSIVAAVSFVFYAAVLFVASRKEKAREVEAKRG